MVSRQLLDYLVREKERSVAPEDLKEVLLAAGWLERDIDEGLSQVYGVVPPTSRPQPATDPITQPTEAQPQLVEVAPTKTTQGVELTAPRKKFSYRLVISIVVVSVIVISSGVFGYFKFFQKPEQIIAKSFVNFSNTSSFGYRAESRVEITNINNILSGYQILASSSRVVVDFDAIANRVSFLILTEGVSDSHDPNNIKGGSTIQISSDTPRETNSENALYVRLTKTPSFARIFTEPFIDKWFKMPKPDIASLQNSAVLNTQSNTDSAEAIEKIKTAITKHDVFSVTDTAPNEIIENIPSYHYKIAFNKEGFRALILELLQILNNQLLNSETDISQIYRSVSAFDISNAEIWVAKKELLPTKIVATISFLPEDPQIPHSTITLNATLKDFNKQFVVEPPQSYDSLENMLSPLIEQIIGTSTIHTSF